MKGAGNSAPEIPGTKGGGPGKPPTKKELKDAERWNKDGSPKGVWNGTPEILPCPFCGESKAKTWIYKTTGSWDQYRDGDRDWDHDGLYLGGSDYHSADLVHCGNCHASGPEANTQVKAVKKWNKARRKK